MRETTTPSKSTAYNRAWRKAHPQRHAANIKRATNVQQGREVVKRNNDRAAWREASLIKEIKRHLLKGRDAATIVTWTDTPYSTVTRLIAQIKSTP